MQLWQRDYVTRRFVDFEGLSALGVVEMRAFATAVQEQCAALQNTLKNQWIKDSVAAVIVLRNVWYSIVESEADPIVGTCVFSLEGKGIVLVVFAEMDDFFVLLYSLSEVCPRFFFSF